MPKERLRQRLGNARPMASSAISIAARSAGGANSEKVRGALLASHASMRLQDSGIEEVIRRIVPVGTDTLAPSRRIHVGGAGFLVQPGAGFFLVSRLVMRVMSDQFRWASPCWGRRP
jgi:hypothetical protein